MAVWSPAVRGSDSQPNPTRMTQTIPVMKAFTVDAFLVATSVRGRISFHLVKHSGARAANDCLPDRASFTKTSGGGANKTWVESTNGKDRAEVSPFTIPEGRFEASVIGSCGRVLCLDQHWILPFTSGYIVRKKQMPSIRLVSSDRG